MATTKPPTPPEARPLSADEWLAKNANQYMVVGELAQKDGNVALRDEEGHRLPFPKVVFVRLFEAYAAHVCQPLVKALERMGAKLALRLAEPFSPVSKDEAKALVGEAEAALELFRKGGK